MYSIKKKVLIFLHTEYHLLLAVNQIPGHYGDVEKNKVELCILLKEETRLIQPLNFSYLPVSTKYFQEEIPISGSFKPIAKAAIDDLSKKQPLN